MVAIVEEEGEDRGAKGREGRGEGRGGRGEGARLVSSILYLRGGREWPEESTPPRRRPSSSIFFLLSFSLAFRPVYRLFFHACVFFCVVFCFCSFVLCFLFCFVLQQRGKDRVRVYVWVERQRQNCRDCVFTPSRRCSCFVFCGTCCAGTCCFFVTRLNETMLLGV